MGPRHPCRVCGGGGGDDGLEAEGERPLGQTLAAGCSVGGAEGREGVSAAQEGGCGFGPALLMLDFQPPEQDEKEDVPPEAAKSTVSC